MTIPGLDHWLTTPPEDPRPECPEGCGGNGDAAGEDQAGVWYVCEDCGHRWHEVWDCPDQEEA